ncbi:MAG: sigma-70 family RNA polymerase sigma factor [candidate division Zixibacteria bacterium]|nr:sigma-70 family RNA polymerase sigma factor [candidate division Zixibacteria bacterium]
MAIKTDEKELVKQAKAGDFKSFTKLIENYQQKIFGFALKMAKNREDAEDIFQETFLKAVDNIQKFRGDASFGTWLYRIAINIIRAKYGRENKKELLPLEDYLPIKHGDHSAHVPQLFDWNDPLSKLTNDEINTKIKAALSELPQKYQLPFLLRYTQELSVQEVADTLKLSLAATKSRILRARMAMRSSLSGYLSGEDTNVTLS